MLALVLLLGVAGAAVELTRHDSKLEARVLGTTAKKPDQTPPVVSISFPTDNRDYGEASWAAACSAHQGVCGSASDASGVQSVEVRFDNGPWVQASGTTSWYRPLPLPTPDGTYTVSVRATDKATPMANTGNPLLTTFRVDTAPPPRPSIGHGPDSVTFDTSARFAFSDSEAVAGFECQLDGERATPCTSPFRYTRVGPGDHALSVVAVDAAGNHSPAAAWSWTVLIDKAIGITGDAAGPLYPGMAPVPLDLKVSNAYNFAIEVVGIDVSTAAPAGCAASNLEVQGLAASHSTPIVVPASSSRVLSDLLPAGAAWPADWPAIRLKDNPTSNQDGCKNARFILSYAGTATKP